MKTANCPALFAMAMISLLVGAMEMKEESCGVITSEIRKFLLNEGDWRSLNLFDLSSAFYDDESFFKAIHREVNQNQNAQEITYGPEAFVCDYFYGVHLGFDSPLMAHTDLYGSEVFREDPVKGLGIIRRLNRDPCNLLIKSLPFEFVKHQLSQANVDDFVSTSRYNELFGSVEADQKNAVEGDDWNSIISSILNDPDSAPYNCCMRLPPKQVKHLPADGNLLKRLDFTNEQLEHFTIQQWRALDKVDHDSYASRLQRLKFISNPLLFESMSQAEIIEYRMVPQFIACGNLPVPDDLFSDFKLHKIKSMAIRIPQSGRVVSGLSLVFLKDNRNLLHNYKNFKPGLFKTIVPIRSGETEEKYHQRLRKILNKHTRKTLDTVFIIMMKHINHWEFIEYPGFVIKNPDLACAVNGLIITINQTIDLVRELHLNDDCLSFWSTMSPDLADILFNTSYSVVPYEVRYENFLEMRDDAVEKIDLDAVRQFRFLHKMGKSDLMRLNKSVRIQIDPTNLIQPDLSAHPTVPVPKWKSMGLTELVRNIVDNELFRTLVLETCDATEEMMEYGVIIFFARLLAGKDSFNDKRETAFLEAAELFLEQPLKAFQSIEKCERDRFHGKLIRYLPVTTVKEGISLLPSEYIEEYWLKDCLKFREVPFPSLIDESSDDCGFMLDENGAIIDPETVDQIPPQMVKYFAIDGAMLSNLPLSREQRSYLTWEHWKAIHDFDKKKYLELIQKTDGIHDGRAFCCDIPSEILQSNWPLFVNYICVKQDVPDSVAGLLKLDTIDFSRVYKKGWPRPAYGLNFLFLNPNRHLLTHIGPSENRFLHIWFRSFENKDNALEYRQVIKELLEKTPRDALDGCFKEASPYLNPFEMIEYPGFKIIYPELICAMNHFIIKINHAIDFVREFGIDDACATFWSSMSPELADQLFNPSYSVAPRELRYQNFLEMPEAATKVLKHHAVSQFIFLKRMSGDDFLKLDLAVVKAINVLAYERILALQALAQYKAEHEKQNVSSVVNRDRKSKGRGALDLCAASAERTMFKVPDAPNPQCVSSANSSSVETTSTTSTKKIASNSPPAAPGTIGPNLQLPIFFMVLALLLLEIARLF